MEIYWPQEDSFLMQDAIRKVLQEEKVKPERVLDLGTGSGILALEAARFAKLIDAVDINKSALEFVKQQIKALNFNNINVFYSDLFSNVKGKYDLIIFNPPYLPDEPEPGLSHLQKQDIIAGKRGNEIICRFLEQAKNFLNNDGKILFCCSSLSNRHEIENALQKIGYSYEIIARKKLFFEELFVYLAKLRKS